MMIIMQYVLHKIFLKLYFTKWCSFMLQRKWSGNSLAYWTRWCRYRQLQYWQCILWLFLYNIFKKILITRMWANAQHDGCPAEYRWRRLFDAAKFGWRPLLECHAVTLPRCETHWNVLGCPKLANRSQPLVGRSSPYGEDMWRRHCCLTSFFPIVDTCLSCEDIARQSCAMVPRWQIFGSCISSKLHAAHFRPAF